MKEKPALHLPESLAKRVAARQELRCCIIDDESMAIKVIERHLVRVPGIVTVATFTNAMEAFAALPALDIDVLFLDIQMPGLSGFELLSALPQQPLVIFTTAHREFALDSYNFHVIDYLLKPIGFERFVKAIGKTLLLANMNDAAAALPAPGTPVQPAQPFIYIKCDRQFVKILLDDIQYVESVKNHVQLVTDKGKFITLVGITEMEEKLPPQRFLRIHRSFIVSIHRIEQFTHTNLTIGKKLLPIGSVYKSALLEKLEENVI
jgi:DNA-binding LytR/AlgR family response regulator